jgi:oxygen-independent coproporphyrinogen-3 oxidase
MAFGIYVHIPYCLQICSYCDFTKYELGKTLSPAAYTDLLIKEIRQRAINVPQKELNTIYFGGGTPSLLHPSDILSILQELEKAGFRLDPDAELTIEIDPTTVDEKKLDQYLSMGINRFSVGAQTFDDRMLKMTGRKHTSADTVELLTLLKSKRVNYSFDLLFALPSQTLAGLRDDLSKTLDFGPNHLSAYCLTIPEGHKLDPGRAPEDEQIAMFDLIEENLAKAGIYRYEISNFARPGFESRHNLLYWTDQAYWGIGLSSHSYFPPTFSTNVDAMTPWGARFWNERAMKKYEAEINRPHSAHTSASLLPSEQNGSWSFLESMGTDRMELLKLHQALTDYCHTSLRLHVGMAENALRLKFGEQNAALVKERLLALQESSHIQKTPQGWTLSRNGRLAANLVFEKLTFLADLT